MRVDIMMSKISGNNNGWWHAHVTLSPDDYRLYDRLTGTLSVPGLIEAVGISEAGDLYLKDDQGSYWQYLISWERLRSALQDKDASGLLSRIAKQEFRSGEKEALESKLDECRRWGYLTWSTR
jgi:hypothetical protein